MNCSTLSFLPNLRTCGASLAAELKLGFSGTGFGRELAFLPSASGWRLQRFWLWSSSRRESVPGALQGLQRGYGGESGTGAQPRSSPRLTLVVFAFLPPLLGTGFAFCLPSSAWQPEPAPASSPQAPHALPAPPVLPAPTFGRILLAVAGPSAGLAGDALSLPAQVSPAQEQRAEQGAEAEPQQQIQNQPRVLLRTRPLLQHGRRARGGGCGAERGGSDTSGVDF